VDITFFGRSGEIANQYLRKGSKILIEGRLSFDQWSDQNGQKHSKHSVIVETMQMVDSKNASTSDSTPTPPPQTTLHQETKPSYQDNPYETTIAEEDIPF
jgi:single-strand DNA-binding protein